MTLLAATDFDPAPYVVGVSWGNDSVALVQHLYERSVSPLVCLYNDTGWSMPAQGGEEAWLDRVDRMEAWARSLGIQCFRTSSIGMEALVRQRNAWPRQGMQFCTEVLKVGPTIAWLEANDPRKKCISVNGKRRAEGHMRAATPEWVDDSPLHGERLLWQPLFNHDTEERDALIIRAGHEVLPHKSKECMLCVNTNREGLRVAPEVAIAFVERIENDIPPSPTTGKPKTMFRPARKMGAVGIRAVVAWAKSPPRKYHPGEPEQTDLLGDGPGCNGGYCE